MLIQLSPLVLHSQNRLPWRLESYDPGYFKRDGAGLLSFKNKMWLLGGWRPGNLYNDVWNSEDGKDWTLVTNNAGWSPRHCAGYVVFKDKMWIVSGEGYPDVWSSSDGLNWEKVLASAPFGRRYAPLVFEYKDKLWLMGGASVIEYGFLMNFNDIWNSDDGVTWTKVLDQAPWPPRTTVDGPIIHDDKMWILGGAQFIEPSGQLPREYLVDVWNSSDGIQWNLVLDSVPWTGRIWANTKVYADKIWVMGGLNDKIYESEPNRNDLWYSSDGRNWVGIINSQWKERHAASSVVHNNTLWLLAGTGVTSHGIKNDIWSLTLNGLTFISQPDTVAHENSLYSYKVFADFSKSGEKIKYKLLTGPEWLSIDEGTGLLQGIPDYRNIGDTIVSVEAYTDDGQHAAQEYLLHILRNLTINSPAISNGVLINDVVNITWTMNSVINNIDINYSIDSGKTWFPIVTEYPAETGVFEWSTPSQTAENCILRILNSDNHSEIANTNPFSLTPLTITNNPGDSFFATRNYSIEWKLSSPQEIEDVFFSLVFRDTGICVISDLPGSASSLKFDFKTPEVQGDYAFRIFNSTDSCMLDEYNFSVVSLDGGLLVHLPLDSVDIINKVNNQIVGIVNGATLVSDSLNHGNSYYYFDGADDYIAISPQECFPFEGSFTISFWFKSGSSNTMSPFSLSGGYENKNIDFILNDSFQVINIFWNGQGDNNLKSDYYKSYTDDAWHHIIFKRYENEVYMYIDSRLITKDLYYDPIGSGSIIKIGFSSYSPYFYEGYVDDIRIYDYSLSETIISELYRYGKRKLNVLDFPQNLFLEYNDVHEIQWESDNISYLNFEYSDNGGKSWNLIEEKIPASSGVFSWIIPDIESDQVRLKISDSDSPNFYWLSALIIVSSKPFFKDTLVHKHYGDEPFSPEVLYSTKRTLQFESHDTTIVRITNNKLQILTTGETYISARYSDDSASTVRQKIIVLKKDLHVSVNGKSIYGNPDTEYFYVFTGFAGSDSVNALEIIPEIATFSLPTKAGEYPLLLMGGYDTNYNFVLDTGILLIQKALLNIKVNDQTRCYGEKNPEATFIITGFKYDDTIDSLTNKPTVITNAVDTSISGQYPIIPICNPDNNYEFDLIEGVLTIIPIPPLPGEPLVKPVDSNSLVFEYSLISNGGDDIVEHGIVWGNDPRKMENIHYVRSDKINYEGTVSDLVPNTYYYFKSFAMTLSGTSTSEIVSIKTLGSGSVKIDDSQIHIYPNPSAGIINLEVGDNYSQSSIIEIFSVSGSLIYKKTNNQNNLIIDLSQYPKGIYLVKVYCGVFNTIQRVIIY